MITGKKNSSSFFGLPTLILAAGLLFSCSHTAEKRDREPGLSAMRDSAVKYNHEIVRTEMQEMDDYAARHHWSMETTTSGLRYMAYRKGNGPLPAGGDVVLVQYSMKLLNGIRVGNRDSFTLIEFEIGKRKVIRGLEEGVRLMNAGSRARLIVPSHLAYGLLGEDQVPSGSVLVIDVGLVKVRQVKNQ